MLPIYPVSTIRKWDEYTIKNEPIASIDLMERAAKACVAWLVEDISKENPIDIVCGNGNNGGDGLAIARLLLFYNYQVRVFIKNDSKKSEDNLTNLQRLKECGFTEIITINENTDIDFQNNSVIIDCIFGTGLDRPVEGFWMNVIHQINQSNCPIISIDIPSGLFTVDLSQRQWDLSQRKEIIKAETTLTFQTPKLSMLIPGWGDYCGQLIILDICLSQDFCSKNPSDLFFTTFKDIKKRFKKREKFSHKGTFGHALMVVGNKGKCGAAILSSKACLKGGAGLVTVHSNDECSFAIHTSIPEVMIDNSSLESLELKRYSAIGIGPGIGTESNQKVLLQTIIKNTECHLLMDADALNIYSQNPEHYRLPANSILTPHPKEFDRLAGESKNAYERLQKAQNFAKENNIVLVLKGAYTAICNMDGKVFFNSTGNAGMATAGSGDVLSGIITSLLAQGYLPIEAAIVGVYIHGAAGDFAAKNKSITGIIASDIIENLDLVFRELEG
jgi:ADP-dependent NAD(P)H-hydrate dehydratase / NAD(P)H-hydrate epimerase